MSKKRILLCGESTSISSGYANYGLQIMNRLHKTNEFELGEVAAFPKNQNAHLDVPWVVYSRDKSGNLLKDPKDIFESVVYDFKPDIVWSFRDPWVDDFIGLSPFKKRYHWAYMPTIDAVPLDPHWIYAISKADSVFTYSDWALEILRKNYPNINAISSASPAGDDIFVVEKDKRGFKEKNGINPNCLIIGTVMRNQRRKLYPDLFDAFEMLLKQAPKEMSSRLILYVHTTYPDLGWDIPKLISERPSISNKVFFNYVCSSCSRISILNFSGSLIDCNYCKTDTCIFPTTKNGVKRESMLTVYSLMDLYVQYSCAEGFGMPLVEAGSCGVPVCATDYSAMSDIVRKLDGYPIKVQRMFYEPETHRTLALPDNQNFVDICIKHFEQPESIRKYKSLKISNLTKQKYNYDDVAKKLSKHFNSIPKTNSWELPKNILDVPEYEEKSSSSDFLKRILSQIYKDDDFLFLKYLKILNYSMANRKSVYDEVVEKINEYNNLELERK